MKTRYSILLGQGIALALLSTVSLPGFSQSMAANAAPEVRLQEGSVTAAELGHKLPAAIEANTDALLAKVSAQLEQHLEASLSAQRGVVDDSLDNKLESAVQSHSQVARIDR